MREAILKFSKSSKGKYLVSFGDEAVEFSIPGEVKEILGKLKEREGELEELNELWKKAEEVLAKKLFGENEELARRICETDDPLVLQFSKGTEELLEYPWEFLKEPNSGKYLSLLRPFYRRVGEGIEVPPLESRPLKALVVISEPVDALQIGGEGFYETIKKSAQKWVEEGLLQLEFLDPPATWEKLSGRLIGEDFDILHFIGHGDIGKLLFEDEMGFRREIEARDFFYFFKGRGIRLVILTACFSGMTARGDVLSGAGTALLEAGIPAVLVMQLPILAQKALDIVGKFYAGLLKTPLPHLLRDIRSALYPVEEREFIPQWGIPVLYLQDRSGNLLAGISRGEGYIKEWEELKIRCRRPELFVGREKYLRELGEALKEKRFVCVYGLSGMGKTALAEEFCHRLHGKRLFPGGVLEISFEAGGSEDTLKGELSRLLTGTEAVPEENLLFILREKPVLLLLDSFEKAESMEKIYEFLRGLPGQSRVIITSTRDVPWAQNISLEEMGPDEAEGYFLKRAETAGKECWTKEEIESVKRICEKLGYIPLAIELVAPSSAHLPLSALEKGIEAHLRRADEQRFDLPERHRRIFAAFEYSLSFASEEARNLFLRLSVFPGGGFYKHIAIVAEVPEEEAVRLLGELHSRGLVKREGERYFLQPILRDFALEKLEERGERQKYEEEFASSFLALALRGMEGIRKGERWAVEMALKEKENLLEAQRLFFEKERYDECLALSNSLDFLFNRAGLWREWLTAGRRAVEAAEKKDDKKALAGAFHNLGIVLENLGDLDEAEKFYKESLKISEEIGDRVSIAASLHQLGNIFLGRGDLDEAEKFYRESLKISEEIGARVSIAASLHQLGNIFLGRGDLDEAEKYYKKSLKIREEIGDRASIALSLGQLGRVYEQREDFRKALRLFLSALFIFEKLGLPEREIALSDLDRLRKVLGKRKFERMLREAVEEIRSKGLEVYKEQIDG